MESILIRLDDGSNPWLIIFFLLLAFFRIYLEIIGFNFDKLPLTHALKKTGHSMDRFHRMGLYFAIGVIVLFAPSILWPH